MEFFESQGIVLSMRAHMDKGVVVSALTRDQGRHAGFAYKSALKDVEIGALVNLHWEARVSEMLGLYKEIELEKNHAPLIINHSYKLVLLESMCAMTDRLLHEREPHPTFFDASANFLDQLVRLDDPLIIAASYIMWELLLLQTLGYGLDLSECVQTKQKQDLVYVSPKSGKAVSSEAGEPYKDRLLSLPNFLSPERDGSLEFVDIQDGLKLTETFFTKWVLAHMSVELPEVRARVLSTLERAAHH